MIQFCERVRLLNHFEEIICEAVNGKKKKTLFLPNGNSSQTIKENWETKEEKRKHNPMVMQTYPVHVDRGAIRTQYFTCFNEQIKGKSSPSEKSGSSDAKKEKKYKIIIRNWNRWKVCANEFHSQYAVIYSEKYQVQCEWESWKKSKRKKKWVTTHIVTWKMLISVSNWTTFWSKNLRAQCTRNELIVTKTAKKKCSFHFIQMFNTFSPPIKLHIFGRAASTLPSSC